MKYFPLLDILKIPDTERLRKKSLLFLISLIAHHHEKLRNKGKAIDQNISMEKAFYSITMTRDEMKNKFGFSRRSIIQIRNELRSVFGSRIVVNAKRIVSVDRDYRQKYKDERFVPFVVHGCSFDKGGPEYVDGMFLEWNEKGNIEPIDAEEGVRKVDKRLLYHLDFEDEYKFKINPKGLILLDVPVKVVYDKNLETSEKLAVLWNIAIKARLGRQPTLTELEKQSGISERTFRKAKKRYPGLFKKQNS
jgi:hypothetical protein